jgi:hypothetical protein
MKAKTASIEVTFITIGEEKKDRIMNCGKSKIVEIKTAEVEECLFVTFC